MTLYYRLTWCIVTAPKDSSLVHLDTSLKHLNMDWRGGTWKQIRMYTKQTVNFVGGGGGAFKKCFYIEFSQIKSASKCNCF